MNCEFIHVTVLFLSRSPGNKWALEQAKRNLVEKYLLVGTTEEIGDFITILEATVPRIFKGATKLFNEGVLLSTYFSSKCEPQAREEFCESRDEGHTCKRIRKQKTVTTEKDFIPVTFIVPDKKCFELQCSKMTCTVEKNFSGSCV